MTHPRLSFAIGSLLAFTLVTVGRTRIAAAGAGGAPSEPDAVAAAPAPATRLSVSTSLGYLGSPGGSGAAFGTGLRVAIGRHFAVGLDLGYGVLAMQTTFQDRWWIMPSMALVVPVRIGGRNAAFDFGAGFGLGASSGYESFSTFAAKPFDPVWAFQLVPTARVHAIAALSVTRGVDVFARAEGGSLLLSNGSGAGIADTTWLMLSVGARFGLL